jgi:hypothetical protein
MQLSGQTTIQLNTGHWSCAKCYGSVISVEGLPPWPLCEICYKNVARMLATLADMHLEPNVILELINRITKDAAVEAGSRD